MHRKHAHKRYRLIYTLGEHPYLGFLIEPHAVLLNANGELSFSHKRLFSATVGDYDIPDLDVQDRKIIRLLDEIEQSAIIKRHYKKPIRAADYFAQVFNKDLFDLIRPSIERRMLAALEMLPGKPLYLMGKEGYPADQRLIIAAEPASVLFHFRRNDTETRYFPTIKYAGERLEFMYRDAQIVVFEQAWLLLDQVLYHFNEPLEGKKLAPFLQKRYISVPRATEKRYFDVFVRGLIERHHVYAEGFDIRTYQHEAEPVLKLKSMQTGEIQLELAFQYGPYLFPPANENRITVRMEHDEATDRYTFHRIKRSLMWEERKKEELRQMGLGVSADLLGAVGQLRLDSSADPHDTWRWLQLHHAELREKGFQIVQTDDQQRYFLGQSSLSIEINEGNDWFDVHATARFGDYEIPFLKLKTYILTNNRAFPLPNGEIALIPEEWFARYPQLFHFAERHSTGDALHLKKHHLGLLHDLDVQTDQRIERKLDRMVAQFSEVENVPLPAGFRGSLRPYQHAGYNWFYFLKRYRFGGCLADDMGLGKTIQTLALLQNEKEIAALEGRQVVSLVIMPTSLIYNWQEEAGKFTPDLRLLVHTGTGRTRDASEFMHVDVVITTYGIARIDLALFQDVYFHYIILDESQQIKNPSSKSFKMTRELKSAYKLALSGTPVENTVADLWPQMTFLNPGLLGSFRYFSEEFVMPIERKKDTEKAARLQAMIKPFILRRTKEQVAAELPPKSEQIIYCEMAEEQLEYYERIKSEYRNLILEEADPEPGSRRVGGAQIALLQGLTKLRQVANHPLLIDEDYRGSSAKLDQVLEHLENALQRGDKVLIFSQFVRQLQVFRTHFDKKRVPYAYLDGATIRRQEEIDRFRAEDDVRIFLISIKAGGVGLNLTEADYVFVLDPWWNPAVEQQAIDRAHRIGQKKTVFIYKFITKNTVEEKILALQARKTKIAESLITTEESFYKSLSAEDIQLLLA